MTREVQRTAGSSYLIPRRSGSPLRVPSIIGISVLVLVVYSCFGILPRQPESNALSHLTTRHPHSAEWSLMYSREDGGETLTLIREETDDTIPEAQPYQYCALTTK